MRQEVVENLRWKKFPVLSDGFVTLVDVMGDDSSITQAARVSYGKDNQKTVCEQCDGQGGHGHGYDPKESGKTVPNLPVMCGYCDGQGYVNKWGKPWRDCDFEADRTLLRYLMRHRHSTPFEMAEVKILVRVPMDCWRQWIRHRTANVNEYSTRYTEAIDSMDQTPPDQWRLQSGTNKQGSSGMLEEWPEGYSWSETEMQESFKLLPDERQDEYRGVLNAVLPDGSFSMSLATPMPFTPGDHLSREEKRFQAAATALYQERLKFGVAREQARKDLPLSNYTEVYWKCDLHNILGFLQLRMDSHAQLEIRQYATIIGEHIIKPLFPLVWEAFTQYRLNAMVLTQLDIAVVAFVGSEIGNAEYAGNTFGVVDLCKDWCGWPTEWLGKEKCRERDECLEKLKRLGLVE